VIPPRLWQVSILTTVHGEEAVVGVFEKIFGLPPSGYWSEKSGTVTVSVYPETLPCPQAALRSALHDALGKVRKLGLNLGKATLTIKPLRRENWAESWKRHFHPIKIGKHLLIKPSWSRQRARAGQRSIILDPGLSFGTGHHPTTLFCLQQLARIRRHGLAQSFLDIGSGSGILAIAAAKLGYKPVVAFDNDPEAIRACKQNVKRNKVRIAVQLADLTRLPRIPRQRYDLICANLISDLLSAEAEKIRNLLNPGGNLVIAGVLHQQFPEILQKLHGFNLTLVKSSTIKEWKSGRFALVAVHVAGRS
jgi:ribosomal protein L11 methyltransferase